MTDEFNLPPAAPTSTPIGDALTRLGENGEGLDVTAAAGSGQKPAVSAGGWFTFGKRDQFGAGGAATVEKGGAWSAIGKFLWRPGGRK